MPTQRDYYSILQVNPSASPDVIDAAYDRLAQLYDPDTSKKLRASARRQELDEAYDVLSDPKRRGEYDKLRSKGLRPGQTLKEAPRSRNPLVRASQTLWQWLDSPLVFAGIAGVGVVVILVAIVLISVLDDSGPPTAVSQPTPTVGATPNPTPPLPQQSPTTAPDKPPEIDGREVTTASGLRYIDFVLGEGTPSATGDAVVVQYTGWLEPDGTKFDSSLEAPQPFGLTIGNRQVIAGWDEGLVGMKPGAKRRLIIPPSLAYGAAGFAPKIPADATLIFDIEMLSVYPAATAAPTPATPTSEVSPTP